MDHENKWSVGEGGQLPIGLGLNLAANGSAMNAFANMSEAEKERFVEGSRNQHTKADMEQYVANLGEGKGF